MEELNRILQQKYIEGWNDAMMDVVADLKTWNVYEGVFADGIKAAIERIEHGIPKME
jgi:hypothetical protein